jgi:deoxyadenosine/deoxycytidine kinase
MDPLVVVVYGAVGVGKSSVVDALGDEESVFSVREPVDAMIESGALDDVYANRSSSGLRLQMLVLAQRLSSYWACASRIANACMPPGARPVVACDGHMSLDSHIFLNEHVRNGRMSTKDVDVYMAATSIMEAHAPPFAQRPELYIFLRGSPEECCRRATKRGRAAESDLDVDFFHRMVAACSQLTRRLSDEQCINQSLVVIDTDNMTADQVLDAVRHTIRAHMGV